MIKFILFLFLSLSVTYAWIHTEVTRPIRNFIARIPIIHKPFLCHECSSFWISLFLSFFIDPFNGFIINQYFISNIFSAFCGFFINFLFARNEIVKIHI